MQSPSSRNVAMLSLALVQHVSQRKHECEVVSEVLKSGVSLLWERRGREFVGGGQGGRSNFGGRKANGEEQFLPPEHQSCKISKIL